MEKSKTVVKFKHFLQKQIKLHYVYIWLKVQIKKDIQIKI